MRAVSAEVVDAALYVVGMKTKMLSDTSKKPVVRDFLCLYVGYTEECNHSFVLRNSILLYSSLAVQGSGYGGLRFRLGRSVVTSLFAFATRAPKTQASNTATVHCTEYVVSKIPRISDSNFWGWFLSTQGQPQSTSSLYTVIP